MSEALSKFDYILPSPIGKLGLNVSAKGVQRLAYTHHQQDRLPELGLAADVYQQLSEYFQLTRSEFDLPIDIQGTPFQKQVWQYVAKISFGEALTYGEIAKAINSGPRAVGNACRNNPIPIIIPCHRVIKKTGMGGYCGSLVGKEIQQKDWLLRHESETSVNAVHFE